MKIKEINSLAELKACRQDWDAILERSKNNNPFLEFPWIETWWEVLGDEVEMYVIGAYAGSEAIAFLPLMKEKGKSITKIRMISLPQSNYMDIVAEDDVKQACWQKMLDYVMSRNPNTLLLLSGFLDSSGSAGMIRQYAESNAIGFYNYQVPAPYFDYLSEDSGLLMKKRLKNHGVDRKGKRLKKEGAVSFRPIGKEHFEDMFRIHEKRWDTKWDVSGFDEEPVRSFFHDVALKREQALQPIVYGLFFEETLIAFLYGMFCRDRFLFYRLAHDDDFGIYSPGKMILNHSIVSASKDDAALFDFTIGEEKYKHEWKTADDSVHHFLLMNRPSLIASVIFQFHKLKQRMVVQLKRHYSIVLFKRNTIGKWKKYVSDKKLFLRKCFGLLQAGRRHLFHSDVRFLYRKELSADASIPSSLERVSLQTVLARRGGGQEVKEFVDRLYKGQKGYCPKENHSSIVWVSEKGLDGEKFSLPARSLAIDGPLSGRCMDGLESAIAGDFPEAEQIFYMGKRKSKQLEEDGFQFVQAYRAVYILGYAFGGGKRSLPAGRRNLLEEK